MTSFLHYDITLVITFCTLTFNMIMILTIFTLILKALYKTDFGSKKCIKLHIVLETNFKLFTITAYLKTLS